MRSTLPSEMTDRIIDYFYDDKETLRVCSLVCGTWLAPSQFHIFNYVGIKNVHRAEAFSNLLDTNPHIANYVKSLTLSDRASFWSPFVEKTFPAIAPKLPLLTNVTTLVLRYIKLSNVALLSLAQENFVTIRSLSILFSTFNTFQDLISLIAAYPRLQNLSLQYAKVTPSDPDVVESSGALDANTRFSGSLRHIYFLGSGIGRLVQSMRISRYPVPEIQSLHISPDIREEISGISEFLTLLGPSLRHLSIGMPQKNFTLGVQDALVSLSQNTSLRSLTFSHIRISASSPEWIRVNQFTCDWVVDTLSRITSSDIERIQISFSISFGDPALDHFELTRIDTVLQNGVFAKLQRVDVMPFFHNLTRYESGMRARMPGVDGRGLLHIC